MPVPEAIVDLQIQSALISAGAALLGSLIGAAASLLAVWLTKRVQASGKVRLYAKIVYLKNGNQQTWGFYSSNPGMYMQIPIWLDVCNTSGIPRVVRNINLYAYFKKKEVASFTQIHRSDDSEKTITFGENEAYTLVIPANSAKRFDLLFFLQEKDIEADDKNFDELILSYYDENNKIRAFHFAQIDKCWVMEPLPKEKNWIVLNRKCKYAR